MMNWDRPPDDFQYILFERVNPERNEKRFYYLAWLPHLFGGWAVVRIYGRKGRSQRAVTPAPFETLEAAWPKIRECIKRRLRHGYRVVQPAAYRQAAQPFVEDS